MTRKKPRTLGQQQLEYAAEAEARRIAKDSGVSEGLWELFLPEAYRRVLGLPPTTREGQ